MAKRRIFLSGTLTEDSFLVRDLGINPDSVRNPISKGDVSYSGERLILLPHKLLPEISREQVIEWVTLTAKTRKSFGIFALVPSNQVASSWKSKGAIETNVANLERAIGDLEKDVLLDQSEKVVVLLNEYDGVDLPDDLCRVLCLDSSPSYSSLLDTYMSRVRPDSDVIRRKLAQRIEQGMGRGIRGISDWCAVVVAGYDLTSYLSDKQKRKYLSPETQTQLEIAEELLESLKGE
jgi:Rad3-related DNA helicase